MQTLAISGPDQTQNNTLLTAALTMGLVLMTIFALMAGKSVLVPFALAILLWFIINALARRLAKLAGNDGEPGLGAMASAIMIVIAICIGVAEVVATNVAAMVARAPTYLANIDVLTGKLSGLIGLKAFGELTAAIDAFDFDAVLLTLANGAAGFAGTGATCRQQRTGQ